MELGYQFYQLGFWLAFSAVEICCIMLIMCLVPIMFGDDYVFYRNEGNDDEIISIPVFLKFSIKYFFPLLLIFNFIYLFVMQPSAEEDILINWMHSGWTYLTGAAVEIVATPL